MSFFDDVKKLPKMGAGLGFRGPLSFLFSDDLANAQHIRCVETIAEHFFYKGAQRPKSIGERPVMVHSLDLSLGSDEALNEEYLKRIQQAQQALQPVLLSDHLCFTQNGNIELGHLNPIPPTRAMVSRVAEKIIEFRERTGAMFLLENISTHLSIQGELHAAEFYREVCERADCGMLLDVTNILVNCHNFKKDAVSFLDELDLSRVVQMHIVGYSTGSDGTRYDSHTENTSDDVFSLCEEVVKRASVKAIVLERDGNFPAPQQLLSEVQRLQNILDEHHQPTLEASPLKIHSEQHLKTPFLVRPKTAFNPAHAEQDEIQKAKRKSRSSFLDELALLLSQENARKSFSEDSSLYSKSKNLSPTDEKRLAALSNKEITQQAEVLAKKRFHEVREFLPETSRILGESFSVYFKNYLQESPWPHGHLRHLKDALSFLEWLNINHNDDVNGQEFIRIKGHLAWRSEQKRICAQFSSAKDTGPLLHFTVAVHVFQRSLLLLLPLPWPRNGILKPTRRIH